MDEAVPIPELPEAPELYLPDKIAAVAYVGWYGYSFLFPFSRVLDLKRYGGVLPSAGQAWSISLTWAFVAAGLYFLWHLFLSAAIYRGNRWSFPLVTMIVGELLFGYFRPKPESMPRATPWSIPHLVILLAIFTYAGLRTFGAFGPKSDDLLGLK